ncbi:MAG: UDP-N-acetylglucosamine 1-carboxyvinyltransferase [Patescibacteria group bacterium]
MSDSYVIRGGKKLQGSVTLSGAKNASIKMMIASLLYDEVVVIKNVPNNQDNNELLSLMHDLGIKAEIENNIAKINPATIKKAEVSLLYGSKIRSSFLLFGPLLKKFDTVFIPNPGGCRIGARPIERIISGFEALGVKMKYHSETGYYEAHKTKNIEGEYTFEKPTHTGTEALILASVCGGGKVYLKNCALEPEIDDLINMLNKSGAKIQRIGKDMQIQSVPTLHLDEAYEIIEDRNEAVTFAALAYATHGDITIKNIHKNLITSFLQKIEMAGGGVEYLGENKIRFFYKGRLKSVDVETSPHPGYMTDWQPQWGLLMSTADGQAVIHETMLESRLNYVQELQKVGAKIEFFQPQIIDPERVYQFKYVKGKEYRQAIRITGVERLHNGVLAVHDLRAGAVVVMAALSAEGVSYVNGISQIERVYENLIQKLKNLGADIEYV